MSTLLTRAGPFAVMSRADGTFLVLPKWTAYSGEAIAFAGVVGRMQTRRRIELLLNLAYRKYLTRKIRRKP